MLYLANWQGLVPYGGSLLELEEDGPHAAHVLRVLAVLWVEVAHPSHSLPLRPGMILVTLLNKRSLSLSAQIKGGGKRKRGR